jgi:hypothetical protein
MTDYIIIGLAGAAFWLAACGVTEWIDGRGP